MPSSAGHEGVQWIAKLVKVCSLWFGAHAVMAGELTAGMFVAFNTFAGRMSQPVLRLAQLWSDFPQTGLSAAPSLQATPPHPAPRRAAWLLMALVTGSLAWACLGEVDVVATATGRLVIHERSKTIQSLTPAVIRAIHVRDGSQVNAGDVLIGLDSTEPGADGSAIAAQFAEASRDALRAESLLRSLSNGSGAPPRLSRAGDSDIEAQRLSGEWADIQAQLGRWVADVAKSEAELQTQRRVLAKLQATLPLVLQREADIAALQAQGLVAEHASQDRGRERMELERDLATQAARVTESEAAFRLSKQAQEAYLAQTRHQLRERASQASLNASVLAEQRRKADQRTRFMRLTAPVSGTVQQLAVHTEGGVVTEAQVLMVVVPSGGPLNAEVMLENKDIGFVRAGQKAQVKLDTFNFTRYGTVPATVVQVSADAVQDQQRGAVFVASLELAEAGVMVDGRRVPLAPGMNLTAEIQTARRAVIEFLLSPVQSRMSESLRER